MTTSNPWYDYRLRLIWLVGIGAGGFLLLGLIVFGLALVDMTLAETTARVLGFSWVFAFAVASVRATRFPCPRCGKRFFVGQWHNPLASKCMHCGLPKYQS
jgi:hypothetical protein